VRIAIVWLAAAACRHAAVAAPIADTDDDDVPDDVDRCPALPPACLPALGDDGCPDPGPIVVHVPLGADDRARLADVARAMPELAPEVDVIVVAHALPNEPPGPALERAYAVALRLEELGAPLEHLLARAAPERAPGDTAVVEITTTACPATAPSASR
jgi:hypothetical protein